MTTGMSGASNIGKAFGNNLAAMQYTYGAPVGPQDNTTNTTILKRLLGTGTGEKRTAGLIEEVETDFMENRARYGNMSGRDVGSLVQFQAQRGGLGDLSDPTKIKDNLKATAKSISSIRDIIKGPMTEVIRQLESTFGGQAINTFGLGAAADKMQQYRQMAEMTGTTTGQIAQYARASGMISQQISGHTQGAGSAGLIIGGVMTGGFREGALHGINLNRFAQVVSARVTGAQLSTTSHMVGAAKVAMRQKGYTEAEIKTFSEKAMTTSEVLNAEKIAELAGEGATATGTVSARDVEMGRFSMAARDEATKNDTGTYTAINQTRQRMYKRRIEYLKEMGVYKEGMEKLNVVDLEKKVNDVAKSGQIREFYNYQATNEGYDNAEQMSEHMAKIDRAKRMTEQAAIQGEVATKLSKTSGGISGFLKKLAAGESVEDATKDLLALMTTDESKAAMKEMIQGKGKKVISDFIKKGGTAAEKAKRQQIVMKKIQLIAAGGIDSKGDVHDVQEEIDNLKDNMDADFKDYEGSNEGTLDRISGNIKKGKTYSQLDYAGKRKAKAAYIREKLADAEIDTKETKDKKMSLEELQTFAKEQDALNKDLFKGKEEEFINEEITRPWLEEIYNLFKSMLEGKVVTTKKEGIE